MIFEDQDALKERILETCDRKVYGAVPIHEDSSNYMNIIGSSVLRLDDNDYFILADANEGRFGIDDQPKFWVKRAIDLATGDKKIIKLVFHEQFTTSMGIIPIRCTRNPEKESAFLKQVRGDARFMQGFTIIDPVGNDVRVIDLIRGKSFYSVLGQMDMPHEEYYHEVLPGVMTRVIGCIEAMASVHRAGHHHGDIRNDHIFIESSSGEYIWIDFDYEVNFADYDVWSMGNILNYAVGMGSHTFHDVSGDREAYPNLRGSLDEHDSLMLTRHRVANLRKLFPYISRDLNDILLRFSTGSIAFYQDLESQITDLRSLFG